MDFEHQKATTETYREQWERVFQRPQPRGEFEWHLQQRPQPIYKSGCPILEDK